MSKAKMKRFTEACQDADRWKAPPGASLLPQSWKIFWTRPPGLDNGKSVVVFVKHFPMGIEMRKAVVTQPRTRLSTLLGIMGPNA